MSKKQQDSRKNTADVKIAISISEPLLIATIYPSLRRTEAEKRERNADPHMLSSPETKTVKKEYIPNYLLLTSREKKKSN